ncbi:MAG: T9SS type A sorting domain-containing protein, partial [Ignavibacteriaceae bacterium]|nr:T9SS type A sorting domain-containing protein [Ignavibacteriaceae bacterium]
STDNGNTWSEVNNGLTNYDINALVSNTYELGDNVFAGTPNGVFQSSDNGMNWFELPDGLTTKDVRSLSSSWNGYLYAGTVGGGVFRSTASTTSVENENINPSLFILYQNYPNPFNPSTTIRYSIPVSRNSSKGETFVTLKVYDVLGNEITTLINEEKSAGNYEIQFDATDIPSGVYFYTLRTEEFTQTRKLVLLK